MLRSGEDAIKAWADESLDLLRSKGGEGLLEWLTPQLKGLRGKKRDALNSLMGDFHSRVGLTAYPTYRENRCRSVQE